MQTSMLSASKTVQQWLQEIDLGIQPSAHIAPLPQSHISLLRWQSDRGDPKLLKARPLAHDYRISLLLQPLSTQIWNDGKPTWEGELPAGYFRICPPGVASQWNRSSGCDIVNLFVPAQLVHELCALQVGREAEGGCYAKGDLRLSGTAYRADPFVWNTVQHLLAAWRKTGPVHTFFCDSLSTALVAHLVEHYSDTTTQTKNVSGVSNQRMQGALDYMENHLTEEINVADLAQRSHMSVSHFSREFQRCFGQSPHRYMLQRRLEFAREALLNSSCHITTLAVDIGFHDASHFSRAFSRQFGLSPTSYRRLHQSN